MFSAFGNNPVKYVDPDGREEVRSNEWWEKNWRREPWIKSGHRQGVDMNLMPQNKEPQYVMAESHVSPTSRNSGPFIVAAHGSSKGVYEYEGFKPDSIGRGIPKLIPAKELAERIKNNSAWEKSNKIVILYVCDVGIARKNGKEYISYAQELANFLGEGVKVYAPNGNITVGWVNNSNKIKTADGKTGKMLLFVGRKYEK